MNLIFYLFVILTIVGFDQYTKKLVTLFIAEGDEISIIDGFLRFINVKNSGAAFSILQNQRLILILFPIIFIIICIFFIIKNRNKSKLLLLSLSFIIAGGVGNLIDRIKFKYVVDFIDFNFGSYHYPTFNVADSFAVIGVILLLIYSIFFEKKKNENNQNSN